MDPVAILQPRDAVTHAIECIDYPHREIHEGNHYYYGDSITLANGVSQEYMITTPNTTKWAHTLFQVDGTAVTSYIIAEDGDRVGTAVQSAMNNNRNSANTSGLVIHKATSGGTTDGTSIFTYASGTATNQSRSSSQTRNENEVMLKQNTKYLLTVTSGTDGNLVNVRFTWYEHISKN